MKTVYEVRFHKEGKVIYRDRFTNKREVIASRNYYRKHNLNNWSRIEAVKLEIKETIQDFGKLLSP